MTDSVAPPVAAESSGTVFWRIGSYLFIFGLAIAVGWSSGAWMWALLGAGLAGSGISLFILLERQRRMADSVRQLSEAHARSHSRLARVLDATEDGVWEFDVRRNALFCSDNCSELAGLPPTPNFPWRVFLRQLGAEQRRRVLRALRAAWNEAGRFDELLSVGNGAKRWLRLRARVDKERLYLTGVLSDVTDELELTRERGNYQRFMEGVIDALPLPMSVKNRHGSLVLVNRAYSEALRLASGETIGKPSQDLVHAEAIERLDALDTLTLETGRPHVVEDWFDVANANRRDFLRITKSRCMDRYGLPVVVTTYEDQSAARNYAQRMALLSMNVENFVQRLIRAIPHPIYVKSADSRYSMVNSAIAEQWGLRAEDMVGLSSREIFGEELGGPMEAEDQRVLAGEVLNKEECRLDPRTGVKRYWAVTKTSCLDVDGKIIIVGSNFEITDLLRSEFELRDALHKQTRLRQFLQQLFDALPHPVFVKDRQHRYVMTNWAHAQFHGCRPEDIIGTTSFDHADASVAQAVENEESAVFKDDADHAVIETEHVLVDAQGTQHQTLIRKVLCDGVDEEKVVLGLTFDVTETRALEQELRATLARQSRNRAFLQDVFDAIPIPVAVKDERHVYVMANRALASAHGMTPEQMIGKTTWDFNLPEVAEATVKADDRLFAIGPGIMSEREVPIRYVDGVLHRVRLRKVVCLDPDGARLIITSNSDVSDLLAKEEALTDSLQRQTRTRDFLQTVFDALPFASYVKDESLSLVMANTALCEFHGIAKHAFTGRRVADLVSAEAAIQVDVLDQALLSRDDGEVLGCSLVLRDRLGRDRRVLVHEKLVRDPDGKRVIIGVNYDVSALHEAEQAQRRILERLDTLVHNAPLGITLLSRDGRFLAANPFLQRLLGLSEAKLQSMRYQDVVPRQYVLLGEAKIDEIRRSGVMQPFESVLSAPDGQELPVMVSGVMVGQDSDEEVCYWLLVQDLIEQKLAEKELLRHRDQLRSLVLDQTADLLQAKELAERSSAAKSDFIAQLSHELRTPLHAILSFARLGVERSEKLDSGKVRDYFGRVAESGERLLNMLDELLDLAKLEAGRMSLIVQPTNLSTLLDGVAREFEALFVARQLTMRRLDLSVLPLAIIDAARMGQVIRNLVSNAVKFAPSASRITLQSRLLLEEPGRRASDPVETEMLEISVIDEGPGIPAAELEQIFERFTQSSLTRSTPGGTGLGLAICREIIQAHRGQIFARNRPSGGAEFVVRIPLQLQSSEPCSLRSDA